MGRRITIVLDEHLEKQLRFIQSKLIKNSIKSISFSRVLNMVLEEGLKKRYWPKFHTWTSRMIYKLFAKLLWDKINRESKPYLLK